MASLKIAICHSAGRLFFARFNIKFMRPHIGEMTKNIFLPLGAYSLVNGRASHT